MADRAPQKQKKLSERFLNENYISVALVLCQSLDGGGELLTSRVN